MRSNYFLKQLGILLILTFSIFGTKMGFGQTYFSESFEGTWSGTPVAPSGWTNIDGTGSTNKAWEKSTWSGSAWSPAGNGTNKPAGAKDGSSVAHYNDYYATAGQVDKLQSPIVDLSSAISPRVVFNYAYPYSSWSGSFVVKGSYDGGSNWYTLGTYSYTGSNTLWTQVSIALSASYLVANAMFSFEITAGYGNADLWFDYVKVDESPTPLTGTKTIKASGGDYSTFTAAINALNDAGVGSGGVTFDVDADYTSTEYLPIITATGTSSDPIVFQKSGSGANPVITAGTGTSTTIDALVRIAGGDYITFDGIDVQENASNSTSTTRMEFGYYIYNTSATNGAQNNTIKNCKITLNRANTTSKGIYQYTASSASNATGANSYNKYQNITIENSYQGIYCSGTSTTYPDVNMEISGCTVGASTSNDIGNGASTLSGIYVAYANSLSLFSNEVRNVTTTSSVVVNGIYLLALNGTSAVYNNKIHDITTTSTSTSSTVYGLRTEVASGAVCNIYNNALYGLYHGISSASGSQVIRVIASNVTSTYTGTANYYYNSARLDENAAPSSTIFYMYYGTATLKNNNFANFSTAGSTSFRYVVYKSGGTLGTNTNYNNYFIDNTGTNCHVGYSGSNQNTVASWNTATSRDANSKNVNPSFSSTTDLHSTSTSLNGGGSPVTTGGGDAINVTLDFDGDTRDGTTPDIGFDEFTVSTKTLGTIVYNQASTNNVNIGSNNNQILRIDMPVTGSTGTLILNSLTVSSLNLSDADIASSGVKLYRTTSTTFSTANQLGTSQSFSGGTATFSSLNYDLPGVTTTYLWVTYDIVGGATVGNTVDAQIPTNGIDVASTTYPGSAQSPTGSRTIADDKAISSITVTQASTSTAIKGASNNETLLLDFYVTGSTSTMPLNSIAVTYTGTSASDINASGVKLYRTATSSFTTDNLLGTAQSLSGGIATFSSLAYDLPAGHTYVWVTFDVASAATNNNKVDAKIAINGINVNGNTYNSVEDDPAGNRNIFYSTYALPFSEIFSGSTSSLPTNWSYLTTSFSQSTTSPYHGKDDTHGIYKNLWSSATTANAITPIIGPITATSQLDFDYRIIEYDGYPATATTNATLGTGTIKVQVSTDGSSYSDIYTINNSNHVESTSFASKSVSLAAYDGQNIYVKFLATRGTAGDYYVDIDNVSIYTPADMEYSSSTTSQSVVTAVDAGTTNQQVLGIQVVTTGNLNPIDLTKIVVNANGTTSATDISNAKIFYTGTSSTFATTSQFGSTIASPTTTNFDVTGTQTLVQGTNYFWLTYDVNSTATHSNVIDGEVPSVTVDGSIEIPTSTAPAGTRSITNKTISSITITQASTADVVAGNTNNQILRLDFLVAGPSTGSLLLNSIDFVSLNTNDADISASGVKLYNTLTSSTFATSSQIGTSESMSGGGVSFSSINYNLPGGNAHTYIWLSYDVSASGTDGNTLDAKIPADGISVGSSTYNVAEESPAGSRILKTSLMGTKTVGTSGDYPTLTGTGGLFEAINALGLKGNLTVDIISDITEPGTIALNQWSEVGGSGYTITIRPDQGSSTLRTLSGSYAGRLISLNGADMVTFDGRISGSGTYLAISNTSTSGSAIGFINDATGNTVRNCDLTGVGTSASNAVVVFSTTTGTTGNDDNTITYNKIHSGATVSTSAIYSYGTSAKENGNITISNNEIYDFWLANGTSYGIYATYYSTGWTISNNSLYQTTTRTSSAAATIYPIYIYDGTGYTITGNYIGGTSASCGGTAWTVDGSFANIFSAIYFNPGATKTGSIQSNTIKNFNFTTTSASASGSGVWSAIYSSSGDVSIGNSVANTVGGNSATSITITAGNGALVNGISVASTGTSNISNNALGGFDLTGAATIGYAFKGITTSGSAGNFTIGSNTIGSSATSNNIKVGVASTTTASTSFIGIENSATGTISITSNTIANSIAYGTGSSGQIAGIKNSGGIATISTNTIRNIATYSSSTSTGASSSIVGISQTSTSAGDFTLGQNVIHTMKSFDAAAAVKALGIFYSGPASGTNAISRNFIHSFDLETSSSTAVLTGIELAGGVATTSNSMIRLGIDASGSSLNNDLNINGILKSTTADNIFYFNSVYIGGSAVVSTSAVSFGFRRTSTGTDIFKNNIIVNNRNNSSGSGKHYTIGIDAITTFTSNNNIYNATGTGANYGLVNTTDCPLFSDWKTNNGSNDGSSADADPFFIDPTGDASSFDMHIDATNPTAVEGSAASGTSILVDFDGQTRTGLTPEDIGADAGDFTPADIIAPSIMYTPIANTISTTDMLLENVTITDASGVNQDDGTSPRIFYKKSTDANDYGDNNSSYDGWKYTQGELKIGVWEFTIDYSLLQSAVTGGDVIQYFVVAQDNASPENVAINSGNFSNPPSKVNLDASAFPISGTIREYTIMQTYSGTYTVGAGEDFTNLTDALTSLDAGQITGAIILEMTNNYSSAAETFPLAFQATDLPGISASNTITLRPASGASATISGSNATAIISLNAVNYITFDGRDGGSGSNKNLTITNTSTSAPAILFINDASNNTVKYTNITGRNTGTTGLVHFSTATSGTTGNDNNIIDYCNISSDGSNYPVNLVYSLGTSAKENNANTISNSNLFDFRGASSAAVNISSYSTEFSITNNSIYQTSGYAGTAATSYGIYVNNTSGNGFVITGNSIGGSQASCGGTAWTVNGSAVAYRFVGIYTNVGSSVATSIQNNTIKNIVWITSSGSTTAPGVWTGIYHGSGNANIGNVSGNTIGDNTSNGSISNTISTTGGITYGIVNYASSSTVNISNNIISGFTISGSTTSMSTPFYGIYNYYGTTITINNNTIGSTTQTNSINLSTSSTSSTNQFLYGVYNYASGSVAITNNTIANLNNNYSYTSGSSINTAGIYSSNGTNSITGNTIRDITNISPSQGTTSSASLLGIYLSSSSYAGQTISSNTIYSLQNNYSSTRYNYAYGIYYYGPTTGTNVISKNKIHSISLASTSTTSAIYGIYHSYGTTSNISNNMVRLGIKADGTAMTTGYYIYGIYESSGTDNFYYNSVYVGGSGVTGTTSSTYAFYSGVTTNTRIFRNNVFANDRSGGTTGKHYAVRVGGTGTNPAGLTINNNVYYSGSGAVLGYYNSADVTNLTNWKTAIGQDANSRSSNPQFISANGNASAGDLHINTGIATPVEGNAAVISIVDDIDGDTRDGSTPDIGADEGVFTLMPTVDSDSKVQDPATQIASGNVSSVANTSGSAVSVFKFTINDLGTSDGLSTKITSIKIKNANPSNGATWTTVLAGAKLNDGSSDIITGTPTITASDITFPISSGNLLINDGTTKDLTLMVYLNSSNITDGQKLQFKVDQTNHGFDADLTGSQFASDFGAVVTGNEMTIQVTATALVISAPSTMMQNVNSSFTVSARDANNNLDLDNVSSVTLSINTGSGSLSSASGLTKSLSSGTVSWSDVQHNTIETIRVQSAASGLTTGVSSDIIVGNSVTIGTGSTTGQALPMDPYYGYAYSQSVYLQSDLGGGFTINQIAYQYNGNSSWGPDAIKVYMANTSRTSFSSTSDWEAVGALTTVYDGTLSVPASSGWVTITLSTPFVYNGSDNLIIAFEENTAGGHSSSDEFYCTSTSTSRSLTYYNSSTDPDPSSPPTGYLRSYIPNVKLITNSGMVYISSTTTQNSTAVNAGATDQQVIGIQVVTNGNQSPLNLTSFTINANGTTSTSDISNAKIYYTSTSSSFAATNQFGSTYASPTTTSFNITGSQSLADGTNYFWLVYDVVAGATGSNVIDAECTSITVGGSAKTPSVSAPSGSRSITQKTLSSVTVSQASTATAGSGTNGKEILRIDVVVAGPATGELNLNSIQVTSTNDDDADISAGGVKIYRTTNTTFATTNQVGSGASFSGGVANIGSMAYNLPVGTTYFWVAYDIDASATNGNTVDAKLAANSINIGGATTYPVTEQDPAGERIIQAPLSGTISVGNGQTYTTLTGAGGLFAAINSVGLSSSLVVEIVSDITEDGTNALNQWSEAGAGNYTLTIQPDAAVLRTISGNYAGGLIRFSGADRVTINGNYSGSGQYLLFSNSNTGTSNNTIAFSNTAENNNIKNCKVYSPYRAITTTASNNLLIEGNELYGDVAGNSNYNQAAIYLASTSTLTTIRKNTIHDFYYTGTTGYGAYGVYFYGDATSVTEISNNIIYSIKGGGDPAQINYNSGGIYVRSGGNIKIYFNSINMNGDVLGAGSYSGYSACILIDASITSLDIRNNNLVNSQGRVISGTSSPSAYLVYSGSANTAFSNINNNNYYFSDQANVAEYIGYLSSARATLSNWQTATGQDANSVNANPSFASSSDLHTTVASLNNQGASGTGITTDFSGTTRGTNPDLGAYEFDLSPVVTSGGSSLIKSTKATVSGSINPNNEDTYTMYFDYGTSVSYGTSVAWSPTTTSGVSVVNYSVELSGLTANTTYHYRVRAVGATSGTEVGGDQTFTTYALPTDIIAGIGVADNGNNTITLSWTGGNGSGSLVKVNNQNSFTQPEDRTDYSASCNTTWQNAGEQFVYDGTNNTVIINLGSSGTLDHSNIWVAVFEYNTHSEAKADIKVYNIGKVANEEYTTTLNVNLVEFTAKKGNDNVMLNWLTASETNNSHYIVERSSDGKSYLEIGRVEGNGTTSSLSAYKMIDQNPLIGVNYYRLAQYDFNGKYEYLGPVSIQFMGNPIEIVNVYFAGDMLNSIINSESGGNATVEIVDISGKVISSKKFTLLQGLNTLAISTPDLASGAYFIRVISPNFASVEKVVK